MQTKQQLSSDMEQGQHYELPPLSDYVVTEIVYEHIVAKSLDDMLDCAFD